jgi:hypothetical protein
LVLPIGDLARVGLHGLGQHKAEGSAGGDAGRKLFEKKTYQFKHSVEDDQITRQKLQISILLIFEIVLHATWSSAFTDAE